MATRKKPTAAPPINVIDFKITKPKLAIATFDVVISGDRLLVDRIDPSVIEKYGETAVDMGSTKPLPLTQDQVIERAKYRDAKGREGFPAQGLKAAIREAAVVTNREISKASVNRAMTVLGEILPLEFKSCAPRKDIGRNSGMTAAPRLIIRPEYSDWKLAFQVRLLLNEINPQQLYSLITLAGQCIGIGNWRPQCGGSFGCWEVANFSVVGAPVKQQTAAE